MNPFSSGMLTVWLDFADKLIKLLAVGLGGVWTYWTFRKKRTFREKLELELTGSATAKKSVYQIYVDIEARVTNIGASRVLLLQDEMKCTIKTVESDLRVRPSRIFSVFTHQEQLEPGEATNEVILWRVPSFKEDVRWLRIDLYVGSADVQWKASMALRVDYSD